MHPPQNRPAFGKKAASFLAAALAFGALCPAIRAVPITIDTVPIGNAGNAGEVQSQGTFGAVAYEYRIGTYEVTNTQYAAFLNAVAADDPFDLYHTNMGGLGALRGGITRSGDSGSYSYALQTNFANKPVNWVTWYDAARFANWLHNGQPTGPQGPGTTETGAYTLLGDTTEPSNGTTVTREPTATWFLPSQDEWYKAAYYDPATSSYFIYPTSSNTTPAIAAADDDGDVSNPGANVANYGNGADWNGQNGHVTTVGSAGSTSPYLTFDQGGNVQEWNETIFGSFSRGMRGSSWGSTALQLMGSSRGSSFSTTANGVIGFRVATVAVPEPATLGLLAAGALALLRRDRRRVAVRTE